MDPSAEQHNPSVEETEEVKHKPSLVVWLSFKFRSTNLLHLSSAISQTVLGLFLVTLSITGSIQSLLLSTFASMIGSVVTMLGGFLWYDLLRQAGSADTLVKDAIKRVINSQN